jgi:UDPglucose--hexose-1-phosphate uridylyltransferase
MSPLEGPHRRYDPLRDSWVLVSAGRDRRPWQGQVEPLAPDDRPVYDPGCYLCPGNVRANGDRNPGYVTTHVFDNDFPALRPDVAPGSLAHGAELSGAGVHRAEAVAGVARVICFSPRHDASLGSMSDAERRAVVDVWAAQSRELGGHYRWVQVFENRGAAMGASNPHPHGQVWAGTSLPNEAAREDAAQRAHLERAGSVLLDDVRAAESDGPRAVERAGEWLAVVPYWASWPYETLVIGPRSATRLEDLDDAGCDALAVILGRLTRRYDALFDRPFPYSMGWHGAPYGDEGGTTHWRLHGHAYPPLLRADARKFMVGYELLAEPQRDLTPEDAAARLREATPGG